VSSDLDGLKRRETANEMRQGKTLVITTGWPIEKKNNMCAFSIDGTKFDLYKSPPRRRDDRALLGCL